MTHFLGFQQLETQASIALKKVQEQHNELYERVSNGSAFDSKRFEQAIALSDFILDSTLKFPNVVLPCFKQQSLQQNVAVDYRAAISETLSHCKDENELHRELRYCRTRYMVHVATLDLVDNEPLIPNLTRLSELADALILGALDWLYQHYSEKWGTPTNNQGEAQPLLVYGMGKLGGKELNFSSDIDLIFAYPESGETVGARRVMDNHQFFTRLAQKLITALNQTTQHGFVYRVDMRLRPFGDSGPLVLSFNAMEDYYQEQGRDWERYAMLKARLIGEGKYHKQLSTMLRPFVYRRYIDFSVIDSLRRMKRMIAQEVRRKQLVNNIKLGAGGIREVEFIVQVFQLIRGGQLKALQQRNLLTVLPELVEHGIIDNSSKENLSQAYCFLRRVENIIQALADQQTQTLPDAALDKERLLFALKNEKLQTWTSFLDELEIQMNNVHQEFNLLIGEDKPNDHSYDDHWQALWDSQWEAQESEEWIAQVGHIWCAQSVWRELDNFRQDVGKRSIGVRGRSILDKLIPVVMTDLVTLKGNEITLKRLCWVLNKIVTRTAYLELLYENNGALRHLIKLCHASEWVSEHIAKYPILLDELIDPKLLQNPPSLSSYKEELRELLLRVPEDDLEVQMETLRQFKQAQQLRVAAADISGVLPVTRVSDHLTALAEAIVHEAVNLSWHYVEQRFGLPSDVEGGNNKGFAVVGYGKVGGIELAYSSDLDLVFLHNSDSQAMTTGDKSVPAGQFYAKLAQRIMHFFNTRTASGILYELDMRLRPSGNSGVLVVNVETFAEYQATEAWTWEHQALVRARAIFGDSSIVNRFNEIRASILASEREPEVLKKDVIDMRQKMQKHLDKSDESEIDIKQGVGGLVDIEFLAQYLVLANAHEHPQLCIYSDNIRIFKSLAECGHLLKDESQALINGYCELRDFGHRAALQNDGKKLAKQTFVELTAEIERIYQEKLGRRD